MLLEQPQVLEQKVAEVCGVQLFQAALIECVEVARFAVGEGEALAVGHAFRHEAPVLPAVDHRGEQSRRPALLVDVLRLQQLLDESDLVVGVEHREGRLEIDKLRVAAQDLDADGVERAEPRHAFHHAADQSADPDLHLPRRLVGEGDGEDLTRPGAAVAQDVGDPGGEHARLAGAGASQHEQRPVQRLHRLPLLRVERVEILGRAPAHGALR